MKRLLSILCVCLLASSTSVWAQRPRPDAFPPVPDTLSPKAVRMAHSLDEMASWDRYPDYPTYLALMQRFVDSFPHLCYIDTIGTSIRGRLILALAITGSEDNDLYRPEVLYSSTMHGDEVTGFYLMLRLADTLLRSYGTSQPITHLLNSTRICINPLSNPDGTYRGGDSTVARAIRYNAHYVDLNRNYPDPFGTPPMDSLQPENKAMIAFVERHSFRLAANLHGGSEVMNYPWDSFTSYQRLNEHSQWWEAVCKRFVDTCRLYDNQLFRDVNNRGYIVGGDWYVISNGRQDYFNYYHNIREITMELSSTKLLSPDRLPHYWHCQSHALINFIDEVHHLDDTSTVGVPHSPLSSLRSPIAYPNPTRGPVWIETPQGTRHFDLSDRPAGLYLLPVEGKMVRVIKQ